MNLLLDKYKIIDSIYTIESSDPNFLKIQNFYHKNPFPNYESFEDRLSIIKKGDNNDLVKSLKKKIGFNKTVLEVGSGTSQLSNYLAIGTNNQIYALDASVESLKLGSNFAKKIKLKTFIL